MSTNHSAEIWVFCETDPAGRLMRVALEMMTPAHRLAAALRCHVTAVVPDGRLCPQDIAVLSEVSDRILLAQGGDPPLIGTDLCTETMAALIGQYHPAVLLIGATQTGREIAARIAGRMGYGLTADCTALDLDLTDGHIIWTRPACGSRLMARIKSRNCELQMGTIRPGVFQPFRSDHGGRAELIRVPSAAASRQIRLIESIVDSCPGSGDISEADIIVAGGRGLGGPEGFALLRELASALGGRVGASRAAVDAGWIPYGCQVGQSGRCVSPKIYIACGISGAVQHLAGMDGAELVISINSDPEAPIFGFSDYGIVGDLYDVIPDLICRIRERSTSPEHVAGGMHEENTGGFSCDMGS